MSDDKKATQRKADAKRAGKRARAWTAMVYQEDVGRPQQEGYNSVPENWQEILSEQLVECIISPLHDKDVYTSEDEARNPKHKAGSAKKAHWHVVISFKSPATYEKACEVFGAIGATVPPFATCKVKDYQQMARYLCHLDQPHKHRYEPADVVTFGAVDYASLIMSANDEDDMLADILDFVDANQVTDFVQFCGFVRVHKRDWWRYVHSKKTYFLREYIKTLAWSLDKRNRDVVDFSFPQGKAIIPSTGEIIELPGYEPEQKKEE